MAIRIELNEPYVNRLRKELDVTSVTEVTQDAFTLLNWAIEQVKGGRVILSADVAGTDLKRLVMPNLDKISTANLNPAESDRYPLPDGETEDIVVDDRFNKPENFETTVG